MGVLLTAIVYVAGYITLALVAICIASGLYYLAELAEEHASTARRMLKAALAAVLATHALMLPLEPQLPPTAVAISAAAHLAYAWLLADFPTLRIASLPFLLSLLLLLASHAAWGRHFLAHYHQSTHVFCFFVLNVWLVPFGFFVSLSTNERTLPNQLAASAQEMYTETGERLRPRSSILSAFSFFKSVRDGAVPSLGKRV